MINQFFALIKDILNCKVKEDHDKIQPNIQILLYFSLKALFIPLANRVCGFGCITHCNAGVGIQLLSQRIGLSFV